jgi:hypothetical protein
MQKGKIPMMSTATQDLNKVKSLAKDLAKETPRSPYSSEIAGIILLARVVDKCRSQLSGLIPNKNVYEYGAPADRSLFKQFALDAQALEAFIATGASDAEIGEWVIANGQNTDAESIAVFNNGWKSKRLSDLAPASQAHIEKLLKQANIPEKTDRLRYLIDVLDAKDGRF